MSYLRVLGDGPHFYSWQRRFQQEAGGDKVLLILRLKAHLTDDELWELIRADRNVNSEFDMEWQKSIFGGKNLTEDESEDFRYHSIIC